MSEGPSSNPHGQDATLSVSLGLHFFLICERATMGDPRFEA